MLDGRQRDGILRLHAADAARRPDDVGEFYMGLVHGEMADRHRHVDRLDHDSALPVQDAELVGEFENVAECLQVTVATTVLTIVDVGCAVDRAEVDHVAADVQVPLGIAGMKHEGLGCLGQQCLDGASLETHDLCFVVDQRAGTPVDVACRGAADLRAPLPRESERPP